MRLSWCWHRWHRMRDEMQYGSPQCPGELVDVWVCCRCGGRTTSAVPLWGKIVATPWHKREPVKTIGERSEPGLDDPTWAGM